ncbi:MAG: hypothetical protein EA424_19690, partial [Planctomycetaceae bacterium]
NAEYCRLDALEGGTIELGSLKEVRGVYIRMDRSGVILGGELQLLPTSWLHSTGKFDGNLVNYGIVSPSSDLTITGDFRQEDSGVLDLRIGGLVPVMEHDSLTVGGELSLGGTVRLTRTNDYSPVEGHSVRVLTFASRSAQQPTYEGLDFGGDAELFPQLGPANLTFVVGFSSGPKVVSLVPVDTLLDPGGGPYFEVFFDEPVDPATFTLDDVTILRPDGQPAAFFDPEPVVGHPERFRIRLVQQAFQNGTYQVTIGPEVADLVGNLMNQNGNQINGEPDDAFDGEVLIRLPDLVIEELSVTPTEAEFGQTLHVNWRVRNAGAAPAGGLWQDRIYLTIGTTSSAGDLLLDSVSAEPDSPLEPDGFYTRSRLVTIPLLSELAPGEYTILVMVDDGDSVAEPSENNNSDSVLIQMTIPPAPDLRVVEVAAPANARAGDVVNVTWTAENAGTAKATGTWLDRVYLSTTDDLTEATLVGSFQYDAGLLVGQTYTGSVTPLVPSLPEGDYHVIVVTDAMNDVYEGMHEDNNMMVAPNLFRLRPPDAIWITDMWDDTGVSSEDRITSDDTPSFSWSESLDPDFGRYEYQVNTGPWLDAGTATSVTLSQLPDGQHVFRVRPVNLAGNAGLADSMVFHVDTTPPGVLQVLPTGRINHFSWLMIDFDERIDRGSFTPLEIVVSGPGSDVDPNEMVFTIDNDWTLDVELPPQSTEGEYTVSVRFEIADLAGNVAEIHYQDTLVLDRTPPLVTSVTASSMGGVVVNHVDITFSEPIQGGSFTASQVTLVGSSGPVAVGQPSRVSGNTFRVPFAGQRTDGVYTLTVEPDITDMAGSPMAEAFTAQIVIALPNVLVTPVPSGATGDGWAGEGWEAEGEWGEQEHPPHSDQPRQENHADS